MKLDGCLVMEDEAWALFHGLRLTWEKDFKMIRLESDSQRVIELMNDVTTTQHSISHIIDGIRSIGLEVGDISWSKIPRDNNRVADFSKKLL